MGGCRRIAPAIALLAAAVTLSACGSDGDGTIPRDRGGEMLAALDELEQRRAEGECALMAGAASRFVTAAAALPDTVDKDVKQAILEGGANLRELASDPTQCTSGATLEEETTTTAPPPETTTTTTTTAPQPEQPPGEGDVGQSGPGGGGGQGQDGSDDGGGDSGGTGAEKQKREAGKRDRGAGAGG